MENIMKDQMYFMREYRNNERAYARVTNEFLAFVAEKLRTADLTTAEKYTLLTAFVEDMTGDIYTRGAVRTDGRQHPDG